MGRGNVCVHGDYEGLYYVDYDNLNEYYREDENGDYEYKMGRDVTSDDLENGWQVSEYGSNEYFKDFVNEFKTSMINKFKSFEDTGEDWGTILSNELFSIELEDNEWSVAVKLVENDGYKDLSGLQSKHYERYLEGMKEALFEQFDEIGTYGGLWAHGTLKREDFEAEKKPAKSKDDLIK